MFCRFGSVRRQPAGRGDGLVERGVDAAVVGDRLQQPVDGRPQLGHVAVPQQVLEQRVLGLRVQPLQRVGVGGVAGLDPLGLRQAELVEQDLLQLLGRAEVELAADDARTPPGRRPSPRRRSGPRSSARWSTSTAIPARSRSASTRTSGSSTSRSSGVCPVASSSASQHVGEVEHGPGTHAQRLDGRGLVRRRRRLSWPLPLGVGAQLAVQEAQRRGRRGRSVRWPGSTR